MRPKRVFDDGVTPDKAAKAAKCKLQRTVQLTHEGGVSEGSLCSHCSKLDLRKMFSKETNPKDVGFLDQFMDATCPFCTILWKCIRLRWGSASPLDNGARPRLHVQSKKWGHFKMAGDSTKRHELYRILLAVTEQPLGFKSNRRRVPTDKWDRFIIGEVELWDQTIIGQSVGQSPEPRLRGEVGPFFDIDKLRRWLRICQGHEHETILDRKFFNGGFRLIDVVEARLVEVMEPCDYIALSYVWGPHDPNSLKTVRENVTELENLHALEVTTQSVYSRLPRTIANAMELCKAIGYRYLWVDSLCIVQDDEQEKQRLIHGMDHVYENASLTIIAASGQDADAGLAGMRAREHQLCEQRYTVQFPDALLSVSIAPISLEEQVRKSEWNARAWTLQEASLSTRRLYFTSGEVFFECPRKMWRERYAIEDSTHCAVKKSSPLWEWALIKTPLVAALPKDPERSWDHDMYAATVSNYSRRKLSYSEDILNAFSGIYQRCTSAQQSPPSLTAIQGLNSASFAHSLLWFIPDYDASEIKRRDVAHGIRLSSWSWASWTAPVDFVSLQESSFPAPIPDIIQYNPLNFFPFVHEWRLCFKDGESISKVTISEDRSRHKSKYLPDFMEPTHILALLSSILPLEESSNTIGSLNFVAPCITASPDFNLAIDTKVSDGGHLLILPDLPGYFGIIKFDSDHQHFTDLVLVFFDHAYLALCIATEGEVSRRVGVAQLSTSKDMWEDAIGTDSLKIQWKQICLV